LVAVVMVVAFGARRSGAGAERAWRAGEKLMTVPVRKPRGRPFKPGNPGRPPGARNRVTQTLEQLAEGQAEQLFQKILEQALAGDVSCQRMLMDRIWPPRKAQPINVTMPPINSSEDALAAIASICAALGEGHLTPEETSALCSVVGRSIQVIEVQDVERRLAALEEARDKRDEEKNS